MSNDPETTAFNGWFESEDKEHGERAAFAAGWEAAERFARFLGGTLGKRERGSNDND